VCEKEEEKIKHPKLLPFAKEKTRSKKPPTSFPQNLPKVQVCKKRAKSRSLLIHRPSSAREQKIQIATENQTKPSPPS
jgi:hypothetical protein